MKPYSCYLFGPHFRLREDMRTVKTEKVSVLSEVDGLATISDSYHSYSFSLPLYH